MARRSPKRIGLAIVGAGRVGLFRGEVATRHPQVDWIGVADLKRERAQLVADKCKAEFVTTDYRDLLARPEVTAAIISTDEHLHVEPILAAVERKLALLIEKPLATELAASQRVLDAIRKAGVDACVGYTQRFRRRWLAAKEKVRTGTHALDVVMWMMEAKTPVEIYARSVDKALGPQYKGIDATAGIISFEDGALYHAVISGALPTVCPGAEYSLEVVIPGTEGVITVDDTHRDIV